MAVASALPPVVDAETWRRDLEALRVREKAATRELDAVAAQRRQMPMVELPEYTLDGPDGRGTEQLGHMHGLVDVLPYGRQEEWQEVPDGWPQHPTYEGGATSQDIAAAYGRAPAAADREAGQES